MGMDKEFISALMQSVMSASPMDLVKMMNGAKLDFKSSFDDIPLEVSVRIKNNEILARIKILEKENNGDQSKTN